MNIHSTTTSSPAPAEPETVRASRHIPSLDGLRAVAVASVVLGHTVEGHGVTSKWLLWPSNDATELGVRLFFVISGFLITGLLKDEFDANGTISLSRFYFRRTLRIFPACYALIFVMFLLSRAGYFNLSGSGILHALTYTSNFLGSKQWWLGHTWSLAVEEQFYLVWPAMLVLLGWRWSMWGAGSLIAGLQIARLLLRHVWHDTTTLQSWPPAGFDDIAWGCLLAGSKGYLESARWYRRFLASGAFNVAYAIPLFSMVAEPMRLTLVWPLGYLTLPLVIVFSLVLIVHRNVIVPHTGVGRFLNWGPTAQLGRLSYSLYLWHLPLALNRSLGVASALGCSLAAATVSYCIIEKPFLALRAKLEPRLFRTRGSRAAAPRALGVSAG